MRIARRCQLSLKPKDCMRAVPRKDVRGDDEAFARRFVAGFCSLLWGATFVVVKNALDHVRVYFSSRALQFERRPEKRRGAAGEDFT